MLFPKAAGITLGSECKFPLDTLDAQKHPSKTYLNVFTGSLGRLVGSGDAACRFKIQGFRLQV